MLDAQNNKRTQLLTQIRPMEGQRFTARHLQVESKADAEKAFELYIKMYEPKYRKAAICLQNDRDSMLHMMFKLGQCVEKKWRRLRGCDYLTKVITGVKFNDGLEVTEVDLVAA